MKSSSIINLPLWMKPSASRNLLSRVSIAMTVSTLAATLAHADMTGNSQGAPLPDDPVVKAQNATAAKPLNNQTFVELAGMGSKAEVEYSKLAVKKTTDKDIQKFAERMINDHESANIQLKNAARQIGLDIPLELDSAHQQTLATLKGLSGESFDREYIAVLTKDHDTAVTLFTNAAAESALNPALQAFARKTLTTLRLHQEYVHQLHGAKKPVVPEITGVDAAPPPRQH